MGSREQAICSAPSACHDIWGLEGRQAPAGGAGKAAALLLQRSPASELEKPQAQGYLLSRERVATTLQQAEIQLLHAPTLTSRLKSNSPCSLVTTGHRPSVFSTFFPSCGVLYEHRRFVQPLMDFDGCGWEGG